MTNCFLRNKRGFTLIEMMVVVAIMGIIAAIGIPQYLQYRRTAIFSSLQADLNNISRAFTTCISARNWDQCTDSNADGTADLDALRISNLNQGMGNTASVGADAPNFCADIERIVGGIQYDVCVNINAHDGSTTITSNQRLCYTDGGVTGVACPDNNKDTVIQTAGDNSFEIDCDDTYVDQPCDAIAGISGDPDSYCTGLGRTGCTADDDLGMGICDTTAGVCT